MMSHMPLELISNIMKFLNVSDRKEAALVCRMWYTASLDPRLQRDIIVKCRPPENGVFPPLGLMGRKLTHLEFGNWDSKLITESTLISLLTKCPSLEFLDLSDCNNLFLSGQLLANPSHITNLKPIMAKVRVLRLNRLRYMTDITFERLVSVFHNLQEISIASTNMIFGSDLYSINQSSPAMLHFSAFLRFVQERAAALKSIDLSFTAVPNEAVGSLAAITNLKLETITLKGCAEISDRGLQKLASHQHWLKVLDISGCGQLGSGKDFIKTLTNNLPCLHTLLMRKSGRIGQGDMSSLSGFNCLHTLDMGEFLNLYEPDLIGGLCHASSHLTRLALPFCPDVTDEFVIELCRTNKQLTELDLSSCLKLTDLSLHAITRNLTFLQSLHLSHCREISDVGILGYIPEKGVVPRYSFDFDHDGCSCCRERDSKIFNKPSGAVTARKNCVRKARLSLVTGEDIFKLSNLEKLQILDLSYCPRVTDVSLAESLRFQKLRCLYLNGLPKLTDAGVITIARHNPTLEEVRLTYNMTISDFAVAELMINCKGLQVLDVSQCGSLTNNCLKVIVSKGKKLRQLDVSFNNLSLKEVTAMEVSLPKTRIVFRPELV